MKEDHQGDKEIPQTKNVLAVQMELTLPQIVSYVVILDSIRMEDGVDLGNKMLEEGINGLREDVMVLDDKHVNMSGKGKKENDDDKFLNITDDLMYQYIIGKQLWSSVVVFDSFGFSILISSWSILICLLNAFTLVFFMLLLMVTSFYKIMRWNKTGLLAYWYWCFCVLLRNAFIKILFVNGMLDIQRRTLWLCGLLCFKFTYWNRTQKWNMVFIVLVLLWLVSLNQTRSQVQYKSKVSTKTFVQPFHDLIGMHSSLTRQYGSQNCRWDFDTMVGFYFGFALRERFCFINLEALYFSGHFWWFRSLLIFEYNLNLAL